MMEPEEMDEKTQELLQQAASIVNTNAEELEKMMEEIMQAARKAANAILEQFGWLFTELPDMPRPPVEIKKDIKYERNPMRLKQLNKELNESYKAYKKK